MPPKGLHALLLALPELDELSRAHLALRASDSTAFAKLLGSPAHLGPGHIRWIRLLAPADDAFRLALAGALSPEDLTAMDKFLRSPWQVVPGEIEPRYPDFTVAGDNRFNGRLPRLSLRNAESAACALLGIGSVDLTPDKVPWATLGQLSPISGAEMQRASLASLLLRTEPYNRGPTWYACAFAAAITRTRGGGRAQSGGPVLELKTSWSGLSKTMFRSRPPRSPSVAKEAASAYCSVLADFGETSAAVRAAQEVEGIARDVALACRLQTLFWRVARRDTGARSMMLELRSDLDLTQRVALSRLIDLRFGRRTGNAASSGERDKIFHEVRERFAATQYVVGIGAAEQASSVE